MTSALEDYAIIGDCRTAAIVSRQGSIDWLCLPDFSSSSVFAKILDEDKGGFFSISLDDITHIERRYIPQTAVLETQITNAQGTIRLTDCMPILPDARHYPKLQPLRELMRSVEVLKGNPEIRVTLDARPDYAQKKCSIKNHGKLGWSLTHRRKLMSLITDFPLQQMDNIIANSLKAKQGTRFWFSLTFEEGTPRVLLPIGKDAEERLSKTINWWQDWCNECKYQGPLRAEVLHSAIILRLLTFTQSGAIIAAATTSLPERKQGWMNWDYRYCWPRDSAVALSAFLHIGIAQEAAAFFDWMMLASNTTRPRLMNMYDMYGRSRISEKLLPWLQGNGGAKPVRIGNVVSKQLQHDVYGEVMMAIENWLDYSGKLEPDEYAMIKGFGDVVAKEWRNPDNGIWEIRGERRHYTYSKVMAWYVFDALIRLCEQGKIKCDAEFYRKERNELKARIDNEAFNKDRNCYTAVFGGDTVDASLLLLPRCGFIPYNDPRMRGTWDAIERDLNQNGIILRYPPGFGGSQPDEGAFIICNFWAVNYLTGSGRREEAEARLEKLLALANDVGLYNEGVDVKTYKPLGNMPQAYSHAGLITAITRLYGEQEKVAA